MLSDLCLAGYLLLIVLKLTPLTRHPMHIDSALARYGRMSASVMLAQSKSAGSASAVQPGASDASRAASGSAGASAHNSGSARNLGSAGGSSRARRRASMAQASRNSKASYTSPAPSDVPSFTILYDGSGSMPPPQSSTPATHPLGAAGASPSQRRSALRQPSRTRRDSQVRWGIDGLDALAARGSPSTVPQASAVPCGFGPPPVAPTALGAALPDLPEVPPGTASLHSEFGILRSTAGTDRASLDAAKNTITSDEHPTADSVLGVGMPNTQGGTVGAAAGDTPGLGKVASQ